MKNIIFIILGIIIYIIINKYEYFTIGFQPDYLVPYYSADDKCNYDPSFSYDVSCRDVLLNEMKTDIVKDTDRIPSNIHQWMFKYFLIILKANFDWIREFPGNNQVKIKNSYNEADVSDILLEPSPCELPPPLLEAKALPDEPTSTLSYKQRLDGLKLIADFDSLPPPPETASICEEERCRVKILWTDYERGNQGLACKLTKVINKEFISTVVIELSMLSLPIILFLGTWETLLKNLKHINKELEEHVIANTPPEFKVENTTCTLETIRNKIWDMASYYFAELDFFNLLIIVIPKPDECDPDKTLFAIEVPNINDNQKVLVLINDIAHGRIYKNFNESNKMKYSNLHIEVEKDFISKDEFLALIKRHLGDRFIKPFDLSNIIDSCE